MAKDKDSKEKISEETVTLAAETLTGDIRDWFLDRLKAYKKPWEAMTEDQQRAEIMSATEAATNFVREAVKIIASEGRKVMTGTLESVAIKDGIKAVLKFSKTDEQRHELADAQGQAVLLVVAGTEAFVGSRGPADPIPTQGDMITAAQKLKEQGGKVTSLHKE